MKSAIIKLLLRLLRRWQRRGGKLRVNIRLLRLWPWRWGGKLARVALNPLLPSSRLLLLFLLSRVRSRPVSIPYWMPPLRRLPGHPAPPLPLPLRALLLLLLLLAPPSRVQADDWPWLSSAIASSQGPALTHRLPGGEPHLL